MKLASVMITFVASALIGGAAHADSCGLYTKFLAAPHSEYRGQYTNDAYHYSVTIPMGFTAYGAPNPANHHGFGVAIGEPPQAALFVNGETNVRGYATPNDATQEVFEYLRANGKDVEDRRLLRSQLGRLSAVRMIVSYTCPGSKGGYVEDWTIALSPDKENVYEVSLQAHASSYGHCRRILDQLLRSWRYLKP